MGPLGVPETIVIFVLALLLFGPKKLPELGKTIGKAMTEFRRASNELKSTWDREMSSMEKENESLRNVARDMQRQISAGLDDDSGRPKGYDANYEYGYDPDNDGTIPPSSTVGASATQGAEATAQTEGSAPAEPQPATAAVESAQVEKTSDGQESVRT